MSFGKRIKQYIDYKGFSVRSFEIQCKLKNGAIYRVIKNGTSLNGESIAKVGEQWEEINMNWLMNGIGEMLLDSSLISEPNNDYYKSPRVVNEIKWYKDALKRADDQIELQKEMIAALKAIIEEQKIAAEAADIDL